MAAHNVDTNRTDASDHPLITRYAGSTRYSFGDDNYASTQMLVAGKGCPLPQTRR